MTVMIVGALVPEDMAGPSARPTASPMALRPRQATSSSSSSSSAHASSASASPSSTQYGAAAGISIPTSTVVGIGLGFVAFALSVLCVLLLLRADRVRRMARARRRNGDTAATFRAVWEAEGGIWGFMGGMVESGGVGGGAWNPGQILRLRRLEELYRRERDRLKALEKQRPEWWEVDTKPRGLEQADDHMNLLDVQPLGVIEARFPDFDNIDADVLQPPSLAVSIFVLMPSNAPLSTQEDEELPDILIGTTELVPMVNPNNLVDPSTSELDLKASISHTEGDGSPVVPVLLGGALTSTEGMRRAHWARGASGIRHVEGLPPPAQLET